MKILALEFSSGARSVAVIGAGDAPGAGLAQAGVLGRAEQEAGRGTRAIALIETALREAGLEREEIGCIAVGLGPGSYMGIRVAIALAQGWQLASAVRALGVNSAEVLAWRAHGAGLRGPGHIVLDAQRGEFYSARGEWGEDRPVLEPLRLARREEVLALPGRPVIVGKEWEPLFQGALVMVPDAATLGMLAVRRDDFITADRLEPVYLRPLGFVKAPPPRVIPPRTL